MSKSIVVNAELVDYFSNRRTEWKFKTNKSFKELGQVHNCLSAANPLSYVNFSWGTADNPSFIAGVVTEMSNDEDKIGKEMTWQEFDEKWYGGRGIMHCSNSLNN